MHRVLDKTTHAPTLTKGMPKAQAKADTMALQDMVVLALKPRSMLFDEITSTLDPDLQARRHDAITAGLFMKPEWCQAVACSEPVLCDVKAFLLPKGNPKGFTSRADIAANPEAKIGAPEKKPALQAGVPRDRVIVVPDGQSGRKMRQDGRIDVCSLLFLSIPVLMTKAADPDLGMFAPMVGAPLCCDGAAFRKEDTALRDAFDVELAQRKASGEFAAAAALSCAARNRLSPRMTRPCRAIRSS